MSLREYRGKWQYRFRLAGGQRVEVVTDLEATEPNRAKAERMERKHRDEIMKGKAPVTRRVARGFADAVVEFVENCRVNDAKPATTRRTETSMTSAVLYFGNRAVASIRPGDVERYKVWRLTGDKEQGIAPVKAVTCRHDLHNLSKFFKWAKLMELTTDNPVAAEEVVIPSDAEAYRIHVLSTDEEERYFAAAGRNSNLHDVARIILLQGCRPEEVLELTRRSVDFGRNTLTIGDGKTVNARRTLVMHPQTAAILRRRLMSCTSSHVFPSPKRVGEPITKLNCPHNRILKLTGLDFVLYDLRHTFATRAAQSGMDLATLATILGHSRQSGLRMVMRYVHPTQEHVNASLEKLYAAAR